MPEMINNCFDSHTHFLATGQVALELSLRDLKSADDVQNLKIEKYHYRGDWLVGFGWNHNLWSPTELPNKAILDRLFPNTPVLFSRVDGHSSWINSKAIEVLNIQGECSGLLLEQDHINALFKLPDYSDQQLTQFLLKSGEIFNKGGFTHVRDMSMNYRQWRLQKQLCEQGQLKIYCEGFVTVESVEDCDRGLAEYQKCIDDPCAQLKVKGLKIFIDGSLGSKTAYLSQNYQGENQRGLLLWKASDIKLAIAYCWRNKMEIAIHCIGDEAVHTVAQCAREVSAAGLLGKIHIEHAQLLRQETVPLLKPLHVYVHMQPSHWLSDHSWLPGAIGDLTKYLFQWELLRKNRIHVDFGSDSPIEPTNLLLTRKALNESAKFIPTPSEDWKRFHTHPTIGWGQCQTEFDEQGIIKVNFDGETIHR
ncbi:metal-dependent hydrolase [Bdellovibrio sp. qaytius]|nr:metal-dependent hydrolase [Bdellovibrio sp. qaytius]